MAVDVSRIYQRKKKTDSDHPHKQNDQEEGGASFLQKEEKKKKKGQCFKCGADDWKTCPCDNIKRLRENEKKNSEEVSHFQKETRSKLVLLPTVRKARHPFTKSCILNKR